MAIMARPDRSDTRMDLNLTSYRGTARWSFLPCWESPDRRFLLVLCRAAARNDGLRARRNWRRFASACESDGTANQLNQFRAQVTELKGGSRASRRYCRKRGRGGFVRRIETLARQSTSQSRDKARSLGHKQLTPSGRSRCSSTARITTSRCSR